MKKLIPLLALLLFPTPAAADFLISWGDCDLANGGNRNWSATDHVLTVYVTNVEGDFDAVDFTLAIDGRCEPTAQFIPQAWRFDPAGCQAGMLRIERPRTVTGCPSLAPGLGAVSFETVSTGFILQSAGMHPDVWEVPAMLVRGAHTFPLTHLQASQNYVVAKIHFDMSSTVAGADPAGKLCGCGSTPIGLQIMKARLDGPLGYHEGNGGDYVAWNNYVRCIVDGRIGRETHAAPEADPSCLTTAALPATWGRVKASYR
jgi:hypothetical protein